MMKKPACSLLALLGTSAVLALSACEGGGNTVTPDAGGTIDSGSSGDAGPTDGGGDGAVVSTCTKPTGGPTEHQGVIAGNETWTADKSPHIVKFDIAITGTLTIEPCAEVVFAEHMSMGVKAGGKLVAEGKATSRIRIAAMDPAKPFAQLGANGGGTMRLAYADIENGGWPNNSPLENTGTIFAQADQTLPTQGIVFTDNVTIKGSRSNGLYLETGAGFAEGSKDLTISGAASYPMSISSRAMGTVPAGKYTGNAADKILIPAGGGTNAVQEDITMHNRGVPYRIGSNATQGYLTVHKDPGFATLTIEPGTILEFKPGGELIVEIFATGNPAHGALVAVGTPAQPIVFTSASPTPAPGDWIGIAFNSVPQATNKIQHARVEYAGGLTGTGSSTCNIEPNVPDAGIRIRGVPSSVFVTNTAIVNSAAHGIDRGWQSNTAFDFLTPNTFTGIVACKVTTPRPESPGMCPDPVPCPK